MGNEILSYTPELDYNVVIISSPDITKGGTYTIEIGTLTKTVQAD